MKKKRARPFDRLTKTPLPDSLVNKEAHGARTTKYARIDDAGTPASDF
ncbi:MAG: hypothetical protein ACXV3D_00810 [Halobacteriota archaeon]